MFAEHINSKNQKNNNMEPILEVNELTKDFGGLRALDHIDLKVNDGEIVALIGPNGAGKTTFFNCITGIYAPTRGNMVISPKGNKKKKLNGLKPNHVTESGLARTFQNIRLFQNMTVLENVMIGRHCRMSAGIPGAIFRNPQTIREEEKVVEDSYRMLEKIGLEKFVNEYAKNLPYGAQRRLEIARAMATEPFILLLDEPAAGMNVQETKELDALIVRIRDQEGISILLIEHDMKLVMSLSDRIYVVDYGKKIAEGTPQEIKNNPAVIKAYLGEEVDA
jgi:branched-chain amino acid transport system ATP-binding protein